MANATSESAEDRNILLRVTVTLDDQVKAALAMSEADLSRYARTSAGSLGTVEAGANRVAAAMAGLAQVAGDDAKISRAAAGWDRVAARYDETTRATNALTAAHRALDDAG